MAIEIVDLPIKHGGSFHLKSPFSHSFPLKMVIFQFVMLARLPEGITGGPWENHRTKWRIVDITIIITMGNMIFYLPRLMIMQIIIHSPFTGSNSIFSPFSMVKSYKFMKKHLCFMAPGAAIVHGSSRRGAEIEEIMVAGPYWEISLVAYELIWTNHVHVIYTLWIPLVMTNIAMENWWKWPIEIDGLPFLQMLMASMAMLNNQMVYIYMYRGWL